MPSEATREPGRGDAAWLAPTRAGKCMVLPRSAVLQRRRSGEVTDRKNRCVWNVLTHRMQTAEGRCNG